MCCYLIYVVLYIYIYIYIYRLLLLQSGVVVEYIGPYRIALGPYWISIVLTHQNIGGHS